MVGWLPSWADFVLKPLVQLACPGGDQERAGLGVTGRTGRGGRGGGHRELGRQQLPPPHFVKRKAGSWHLSMVPARRSSGSAKRLHPACREPASTIIGEAVFHATPDVHKDSGDAGTQRASRARPERQPDSAFFLSPRPQVPQARPAGSR